MHFLSSFLADMNLRFDDYGECEDTKWRLYKMADFELTTLSLGLVDNATNISTASERAIIDLVNHFVTRQLFCVCPIITDVNLTNILQEFFMANIILPKT